MLRNSPFWQLYLARLREFIRQPARIFWVYGFPMLLAIVLGFAFQNRPPAPVQADLVAGPAASTIEKAVADHNARAAGASRFIAQSIAWDLAPEFASRLEEHERLTLGFPGIGIVLRYGQFYGPGTYFEDEPPEPPRIAIAEAARRTLKALDAPTGTIVIAE